jgi:hypothetical protein
MLRRTFLQGGVALIAPAAQIKLAGTFLQLMPWHRQWAEAKWRELFSCFDALGIREVIVQWSATGETKLFPAPIETILKLAREHSIAADLGLRNDPGYWNRIVGARDSVQAYFRKIRAESEAIARQLRTLPFRGWYICEEIDDLNWRDPAARQQLIEYLGGLSASLDRIEPKRPISISGFAQGKTDPEAFADLWREILRRSRIETIMLQDGIGAGKLSLSEIPLYFEAAASAARQEGRTFRPVVELFRQVQAEPFRGVPAPYKRIVKQLEIAAKFGTPVAFSVMDYMSPLGIGGANELYLETIGSR